MTLTSPTYLSPSLLAALLAALPSATALLTAQQPVPAHADLADGHHSTSLPFGRPGFRTQLLVDAAAIAPNGAVLDAVRLRADRTSLPLTAGSVPNVTVALSHTTLTVGSLGNTFAANVTGTPTIVFQGTVQLPGHSDGFAGPMPWDVVVTFAQPFVFDAAQGNLLIDIVAINPAGGAPTFWLDAMEAGGAATVFGQGGPIPSGDYQNLIMSTGNSLEPRLLTIGNSIDFTTSMSFSSPPGVLVLGTSAPAVPIDLTPVGAPDNFLFVDPILLEPHSWTQSFIGWFSTFSITVPNQVALIDALLYAQSVIIDPTANALGLAFSGAMETRIGDPLDVLPMGGVERGHHGDQRYL
jgi:hypothetical protein